MTLSMGVSIIVALSVVAALATWHGSPITGAVTVSGCALIVTVFILVRRALRRASALIDTILRDELAASPAVSRTETERTDRRS
jgi:uncharacterized membrane protein